MMLTLFDGVAIQKTMTADEARQCVDAINNQLLSAREMIYDLWKREGWRALGYANWTDCVNSEFKEVSTRRVWQEFAAATIEVNLLNHGSVGEIPERQLRPLTSLEPEQQREAWQRAIDTAPDGKMTAAHVQQVVDEIKRPVSYHVSDDSYDWYTPPEYIAAARGVLGAINLDPASSDAANKVVQADRYYTKEDDGLAQPWNGFVWLNPPYNMPLIEQFVDRVIDEYESGVIDGAIVLTNNSTDTGWFHKLIEYPVCFTRGRIRFVNGEETLATRQGQAIFYLGDNPDLFAKVFSGFGVVLRKYDNKQS
jgi:ParB family chromosome partitioning protein